MRVPRTRSTLSSGTVNVRVWEVEPLPVVGKVTLLLRRSAALKNPPSCARVMSTDVSLEKALLAATVKVMAVFSVALDAPAVMPSCGALLSVTVTGTVGGLGRGSPDLNPSACVLSGA